MNVEDPSGKSEIGSHGSIAPRTSSMSEWNRAPAISCPLNRSSAFSVLSSMRVPMLRKNALRVCFFMASLHYIEQVCQ